MAHMNGGRGIDWPMATRVALSSLSLLGATGKLTATGTEPLHALGLGLSAVLLLGVAQVACAVGVLFAGQARRAAAVALVIGLLPAVVLFLIAYMRAESRESWTMTLSVSLTLGVLAYLLFHKALHIAWPQSYVGDWFPALRFAEPVALF